VKRFAIDIGGTFTDLVALDDETGEMRIAKRPSTPLEPAQGLLECIREADLEIPEHELFVHGTTIGLNAFLQGRGEDVCLITTEGFRDIYEIGRTNRTEPYNLTYRKPRRLVPRRRVFTVPERIDYRGNVVQELDETATTEVIEKIADLGIQSVAVCLLHAYAKPQHEERIYEMIKARCPTTHVSLSSRIIREYREFERTNVTVLDAYIKPLVVDYIGYLERFFHRQGFRGDFMLQRSGGGVIPASFVSEKPIKTLFSGPAGGVMGALHLSSNTPYKNLILGDVGGTSFDVSLLADGREQVTTDAKIGQTPLMIPILDIRSIGAGGGSVAWLDQANAMHVGPRSAGADPGPVCYGRGGLEPTVTDAAVYNGYISAQNFLGGRMPLDVEKAREAIWRRVAEPLGLSVEQAADGVLRIMVDNMVGLIREILTEKGEDARHYSLLMFGGAGPLFGSFLMDQLEIARVIVPRDPGHFSAFGMMITDIVYDYTQTFVRLLEDLDAQEVERMFRSMEEEGLENLEKERLPDSAKKLRRSVDVRYLGLTHALSIPVSTFSEASKAQVANDFHALHERIYGYRLDNPVQVVKLNVRVIGALRKPKLRGLDEKKSDSEEALKGEREVYFTGGPATCSVYERGRLRCGDRIEGPAIVEEPSSTTVLGRGHTLEVDRWGNLIIERN
jgi:N-methylhydantoinase A